MRHVWLKRFMIINAGLHVISPELLKQKIDTPKIDLDRQLLKPLSGTGRWRHCCRHNMSSGEKLPLCFYK